MNAKRVLVTGANGFVGSRLVPALREAGHEVVVLVRNAATYDAPPGVRVVEGDLLDPGSLPNAFRFDGEPVDAAYYLVHSMRAGADFETRDRQAAGNFTDAADDAGVDRVVYLGGLGEDRDELSPHLRSRREVERLLADGDAQLTTLRAAIIVGNGSASFDLVRQLADRLPVMVTPQWVHTRCQPIAIDDVIAYLVGVLDVPETAGETYEIGGPEVLTYAEILRRTRAAMGRRLLLIPVPVLSPRLSAYWIGLVTDVPAAVARPLIDGLRNPVVADDERIRELLPIALTPFDEAVRRAFEGGSTDGAAGELSTPPESRTGE